MARKCSHCSNNGHNSRTCPNRGVRLFGVRLTDGSIRKSASMGNLSHYAGSGSGIGGASPAADCPEGVDGSAADGYASEDFVQGSSSSCRERKKGVPWTEEEHRMFLLGLQKLGKGDWRGIARNYVVSRTPHQVASHAQKYFIRQSNSSRRKRRSSLFDMIPDEVKPPSLFPSPLPSPHFLSFAPALTHQQSHGGRRRSPAAGCSGGRGLQQGFRTGESSVLPGGVPRLLLPFFPVSAAPYWTGYSAAPAEEEKEEEETHEIVRPTAVHSKAPINVEELVGISKLSLAEEAAPPPSSLSLNLLRGPGRQSAFQASSSPAGANVRSAAKPIRIHAV
ncbi:unnamed protein product [Spirodela intermedia]|uniref:Uncharacterized protein n=1 Tax=Spirodela intermedia TaxID=51605 RepID=A0A7I8JW47_SPIIN|nr:unnamed protein product [Spirodela intermedia]CAA6673692.1 unnamed protein product [Spirodela intermedia]